MERSRHLRCVPLVPSVLRAAAFAMLSVVAVAGPDSRASSPSFVDQLEGWWLVTTHTRSSAGAMEERSSVVQHVKVLEGRFLKMTCTLSDGKGAGAAGLAYLGHDAATRRYTFTWLDTRSIDAATFAGVAGTEGTAVQMRATAGDPRAEVSIEPQGTDRFLLRLRSEPAGPPALEIRYEKR